MRKPKTLRKNPVPVLCPPQIESSGMKPGPPQWNNDHLRFESFDVLSNPLKMRNRYKIKIRLVIFE
jgi:hypothetical protein